MKHIFLVIALFCMICSLVAQDNKHTETLYFVSIQDSVEMSGHVLGITFSPSEHSSIFSKKIERVASSYGWSKFQEDENIHCTLFIWCMISSSTMDVRAIANGKFVKKHKWTKINGFTEEAILGELFSYIKAKF